TAARLGGDKFVVLLPEVGTNIKVSSKQAHKIADEIRTSFELPFKIQEHEIHLTISIGVVLFPLEQESSANLVQYADTAMFEAKREGRDAVRLYSEEMQDSKEHHRLMEKGLHKALELNEFELYFQPQFDGSNRVTGIEALLRWHHPDRGLLSPEIFYETAEQTGLIVPIGDWMIRSACEHLGKMDFDSNLDLSVNISPRQFRNPEFIDKITQILHQTGVDPARLKLEITESMLIDNIDQSAGVINQLKQLGVKISVDNFGTGYSSLASLARFSVDEIKIDQSLIRDITNSPDNAVIVETILVTAQHLKLDTIAEGVETRADMGFLMQINCNKFQGSYFAKPDTFEIFLSLVV
ncbi:MAG: bifunctional diguanylate cyclase/phosphodiesterase, partial [Proteobacteria bacterium]|nr:bifunctional diguanylate cyclase/phosphodiesterase [Pseudomonadota bacterium]